MTEQELQQYLLSKYPKENEECEWKEFKNMKNDFNGKEKDDVISYVFSKKEIRNSQSNMQTFSISPQNRTRIQSLQIRRDGTCVKKYFSLLAQSYTWASTSIQGFG